MHLASSAYSACSTRSRRLRVGVLGLALSAGLVLPHATATAPAATGAEAAPGLTVEEQRLTQAVPQEILTRSGFDAVAPRFARLLEASHSYA